VLEAAGGTDEVVDVLDDEEERDVGIGELVVLIGARMVGSMLDGLTVTAVATSPKLIVPWPESQKQVELSVS